METHRFPRVLGESAETLRNRVFLQNFQSRKLGETTVFFVVWKEGTLVSKVFSCTAKTFMAVMH